MKYNTQKTHGDILGKRHSNNGYKSAIVLLSPDFMVSEGDGVVSSDNQRGDVCFSLIYCNLGRIGRVRPSSEQELGLYSSLLNKLGNVAMWSSSRVNTRSSAFNHHYVFQS